MSATLTVDQGDIRRSHQFPGSKPGDIGTDNFSHGETALLDAVDAFHVLEIERITPATVPPPCRRWRTAVADVILAAVNVDAAGVLRPLVLAIARLAAERKKFEAAVEQLRQEKIFGELTPQQPTQSFMLAVGAVFAARRDVGKPIYEPYQETIDDLVNRQKVDHRQVARMFGITVADVYLELKTPGCVIDRPEYVSPRNRQVADQRRAEDAEMGVLSLEAAIINAQREHEQMTSAVAES